MVRCWLTSTDFDADDVLDEVHSNKLGGVQTCPVSTDPDTTVELLETVVVISSGGFSIAAVDHSFPTWKEPVAVIDAIR